MAMDNSSSDCSSLDDLRGFVESTICDLQHLLPGAFELHEKILVRQGQRCGLHFTLSGPRAVQFTAIWDAARHTILFYDCQGNRIHRSSLAVSADLQLELRDLVRVGDGGKQRSVCG